MRRVSMKYLEPGMVVARSVYDSSGRLLLAKGVALTENFIKRLSEMGIGSLYVEDGVFGGVGDGAEIVSQSTRMESLKLLRETYRSVESERRINTLSVRNTVESLIDEVLGSYGTLLNFYEIRTYDDYTFNHSVDVCILSILTGITLGYNRLQLRELATGALLHDIGKVEISKEILNKPGSLTPEEMEQIRQHPKRGFDILRSHYDIPLLSAHVALQHHERADGSGYPRRLSGEEIHEYAKIVMIADVFDALSSDRPYRPACPVAQALDFIRSEVGKSFDEECASAFISNISPYPVGAVVLLSSGEIAQVVKTTKVAPHRPVVKVYFDRERRLLASPYEVDLASEPSLSIVREFSEEELSAMKKGELRRLDDAGSRRAGASEASGR
ncbi:MAG: HD-GYP domain-containing protein [Thermacetogeniaceae bacterium]